MSSSNPSLSVSVAYDTKVGEKYGEGRTEFEDPNFRRWAHNVIGLLDKGEDPLDIWAKCAHALGMRFWPAMRINDIHHDWVEQWRSLRANWIVERPHLIIGSDVSDFYKRRWPRTDKPSDGFSWGLDFAHQEVRDVKFALIEEMCVNYDVDGFEMDFLSHPQYFKKGQVDQGMPLLTQFVRRVRTQMDAIEKEKSRPLTLSARVPASVAQCEEIGIDITTRMKEGLVNLVVPSTRGYLDMNTKVPEFVALAKGTECEVAGGFSDVKIRHYSGKASIEMMRAAAAGYWQEGATSIHLFNFDCHTNSHGRTDRPLFDQEKFQILCELGDPKRIARQDKHYYVTRDIEGHRPDQGGEMRLPLALESGETQTIVFSVGDDLESARAEGVFKSAQLRVQLSGYDSAEDDLTLSFNGQPLDRPQDNKSVYQDAAARQGTNELVLALEDGAGSGKAAIQVEGIESLIDYAD